MTNLTSYKSSRGKEMNIKLVAKTVREQLKKEFPECKFSVTSDVNHLSISLMSAPFDALAGDLSHSSLNQYTISEGYDKQPRSKIFQDYQHIPEGLVVTDRRYAEIPADYAICNGNLISKEAWNVLQRAVEIGNVENWDESDIQSDYFNVNYYFSISIGKWDKPFRKS